VPESDDPDTMPIEMFEERNKTMCKFCGRSIYWVWDGAFKRYMPFEIETRTRHPPCFNLSNFRKYRYKKK